LRDLWYRQHQHFHYDNHHPYYYCIWSRWWRFGFRRRWFRVERRFRICRQLGILLVNGFRK
jgi:hypothetical protein